MTATGMLDLDSLADRIPVITQEAEGFYKQNCMICFDNQGHRTGVSLSVVREDGDMRLPVHWVGAIDSQMRKAYADLIQATEYAACAIALLLVRELTHFTAVEQASIGSTVDYFLAPQVRDNTLIFNHAARLETSGILKEQGTNTVDRRAKEKLQRLKPDGLPAIITVVEFGCPKSKMVES